MNACRYIGHKWRVIDLETDYEWVWVCKQCGMKVKEQEYRKDRREELATR